ncbi:O-antigen ligase family protein [Massilia endophytica]|uniref:O-antigen ligase family protein n=1 Tax=Massilia endophytica TaxID=2899220 RepID=UPI001E37EBA4|nr:O-antigen ligase family protein [Massilia endophytica]UGQ47643.1 O-antigen ligase family protein [Massilia endophytica]
MLPRSKLVGAMLMGLGALFLCLLLGLMAAVIPPGGLVRLMVVPGAVAALIAIWVLPKQQRAPGGFLLFLLLGLLATLNLWPPYVIYRFGGLPALSPIKLAWLALLVLGGYWVLSSKEMMQRVKDRCRSHKLLVLLVPTLMAWRILTSAMGEQPIPQVLTMVTDVLSCYIFFFIVLAVLRDAGDVHRMLSLLVVVAVAQALLASYESMVRHTLFDRFISVSAEDSAVQMDIIRQKFRDGRYRAQGTFEHPMVLAEFMGMMVPLAAALFVTTRKRWMRWGSAAFLPLAVFVIGASGSRSGFAVLMAGALLAAILWLMPRRQLHGGSSRGVLLLAAIALLLPVILGVGYVVLQEVMAMVAGRTASEVSSSMMRVLMMERGIPLVMDEPLFGYGGGMGAIKLGFYDGTRFNIDNYWLGLSLDAGLVGLVLAGAFWLGSIFYGLLLYYRYPDRNGTAAGLISVSLTVLLISKSVLSINSGFTVAYALVAALLVLEEASRREAAAVLPEAQPGALAPVSVRGVSHAA